MDKFEPLGDLIGSIKHAAPNYETCDLQELLSATSNAGIPSSSLDTHEDTEIKDFLRGCRDSWPNLTLPINVTPDSEEGQALVADQHKIQQDIKKHHKLDQIAERLKASAVGVGEGLRDSPNSDNGTEVVIQALVDGLLEGLLPHGRQLDHQTQQQLLTALIQK